MIPFITIKLDRPRQLRFSMRAMVEFEQATGIKLTKMEDEISFEVCAKLLWIMLKQEDKALTFDETLNLIDNNADGIMEIMDMVTKAVNLALGKGTAKSPNAITPAAESKRSFSILKRHSK